MPRQYMIIVGHIMHRLIAESATRTNRWRDDTQPGMEALDAISRAFIKTENIQRQESKSKHENMEKTKGIKNNTAFKNFVSDQMWNSHQVYACNSEDSRTWKDISSLQYIWTLNHLLACKNVWSKHKCIMALPAAEETAHFNFFMVTPQGVL